MCGPARHNRRTLTDMGGRFPERKNRIQGNGSLRRMECWTLFIALHPHVLWFDSLGPTNNPPGEQASQNRKPLPLRRTSPKKSLAAKDRCSFSNLNIQHIDALRPLVRAITGGHRARKTFPDLPLSDEPNRTVMVDLKRKLLPKPLNAGARWSIEFSEKVETLP